MTLDTEQARWHRFSGDDKMIKMRFKRTLIFFLSFAALRTEAAGEVHSDELTSLPFEQLLEMRVYSASRFEQPISEAPSVASIITADEIRVHGWRTLADALGSIRGLYVTGDRNFEYLGARGFLRPGDYNSRFLLLVDGYRVNDGVYDNAPLGEDFPLDLGLVERIEYIPGPGSSIYGSSAFFGVINVITKSAAELLGPRADIQVGSYGTHAAQFSHGWQTAGNARFLLAASALHADGTDIYFPEFDTPENNSGVARNLDHEKSRRVSFKAELGDFTLLALHAERDKSIPTASFQQRFNDPRSQTSDLQSHLRLGYQRAVDDRTSLSGQLYWGRHDYVGDYAYDEPPEGLNRDGDRSRWWGADVRLTSTAVDRHKLVAGLEYRHDYQQDQYNYEVRPHETYLDDQRSQRQMAFYLQDELTLRDDVLVNLGLRYDAMETMGSRLSPRLAVIYRATPQTTIKSIFGSAFRAPNSYERYYAVEGPGGQRSNPDLKSERIKSAEIALEHQFSSYSRASASVFHNDVSNLISQTIDADGALVFRNLDAVRAYGVEVEYQLMHSRHTRLQTSYSWQQSRDVRSGRTPVNSPRHLAKLKLSTRLAPGLQAGLEARYASSRATLAGSAASYWLVHSSLVYAASPDLDISIRVSNLLDKRYFDPAAGEHVQDSLEQYGRAAFIKLAYRF